MRRRGIAAFVIAVALGTPGMAGATDEGTDRNGRDQLETLFNKGLPAVKLRKDLGRYARGEALAERLDCNNCHGPGGHGVKPGWPKLAGQFEQYLLNELRNFREGQRPHAFMTRYADQLTTQVMHDLALYYACQTDNPGVADESRCARR